MSRRYLVHTTSIFVTALTFIFFSHTLYAEIYTWVDKNGKRHYGDSKTNNSQIHSVQDNRISFKAKPKVATQPGMQLSNNPQDLKNRYYYPKPDVKAIQEKANKELARRLNKKPATVPEHYRKTLAQKHKHGAKQWQRKMDKEFIENCKKAGEDNCGMRADMEKNNVSYMDYQRSKETRKRVRERKQRRLEQQASEYKYKYIQVD